MFKKIAAVFTAALLTFCFFSCSKSENESSALKESEFISSNVDEETSLKYDEYEDYVIVTGTTAVPDNIIIPETVAGKDVAAVGEKAFYDMGWVKSITIADTVLEIGDYAFYGCKSVKTISFSENLYSLGTSAFSGGEALTSVRLPLTLRIIGGAAFAGCSKLENVVIPANTRSIGGGAFDGTAWLDKQEDEFVIAGKNVLIHYNGKQSTVDVPDGIVEVSAFYDNFYISQVNLPESVQRIGEYAFINSSLEKIDFTESIEAIGNGAFDGCLNLKNVTFTDNLKEIGSYAFSGCSSITKITVPENVKDVGDNAFTRCDSLKTLTFSSAKTDIGSDICESCYALEKIVCPKNSPVIDYAKSSGFNLDVI